MQLNDAAFYMGWTGHYAADTAMPLHDSIHHDGWSGDNPKGYTRDPNIHERFESEYVDLIIVTEPDVLTYVPKEGGIWTTPGRRCSSTHSIHGISWKTSIAWICAAVSRTKRTRKRGNWSTNRSRGAAFLRDLAYAPLQVGVCVPCVE
jgi:hypothetical protein